MKKHLFLSLILCCLVGFLCAPFLYATLTNEDCLGCHSDQELEGVTERGVKLDLFVPEDALFGSVHENLNCTDCHMASDSFESVPHSSRPMKQKCRDCHQDVFDQYATQDIHGKANLSGNDKAPSCSGCHGGHQILPMSHPESIMSREQQPETCGKCHGSDELNSMGGITKRNLISRYKDSVHWEVIEMGRNGASCTDCHGHHTILSSAAPQSMISRSQIAFTCQKCHPNETVAFVSGAHGSAIEHGNHDVPNCTTCHGDHDMATLRTRVGDAKNWAATQVCIWCHGNERMMARYGLDTSPVDSYMKDFHGLTQRGTAGASATCADCHDPHHSLPSDHPSSRMNLTNRGATCGKCHGRVSKSFSMSFSHRVAMVETGGHWIENLVKILYVILILISVIGMLVYCFIIWFWAVKKQHEEQKKGQPVRRMTVYEIVSHFILFMTFTILVITGFALKYPDATWVKWLYSLGMSEQVRAFIHRFSAVCMSLDFLFFGIYMFIHRRGKIFNREIFPAKRDIKDFFKTMKYYLGISEDRPRYSVFNFAEKFEFWALVWGTLVMMVTGFILWFPKAVPGGWPAWIHNVARIIHFYEAVLATLAILIWHGFHTVFHPNEYPMNTSWLTGHITLKQAKHHFEDDAIKIMHPDYQRDGVNEPVHQDEPEE